MRFHFDIVDSNRMFRDDRGKHWRTSLMQPQSITACLPAVRLSLGQPQLETANAGVFQLNRKAEIS